MSDADEALEEFRSAQGGAVAHLETMAQAARDAAELALFEAEPMTVGMRARSAALTQLADRCDALRVLVELLDLPANEEPT